MIPFHTCMVKYNKQCCTVVICIFHENPLFPVDMNCASLLCWIGCRDMLPRFLWSKSGNWNQNQIVSLYKCTNVYKKPHRSLRTIFGISLFFIIAETTCDRCNIQKLMWYECCIIGPGLTLLTPVSEVRLKLVWVWRYAAEIFVKIEPQLKTRCLKFVKQIYPKKCNILRKVCHVCEIVSLDIHNINKFVNKVKSILIIVKKQANKRNRQEKKKGNQLSAYLLHMHIHRDPPSHRDCVYVILLVKCRLIFSVLLWCWLLINMFFLLSL